MLLFTPTLNLTTIIFEERQFSLLILNAFIILNKRSSVITLKLNFASNFTNLLANYTKL